MNLSTCNRERLSANIFLLPARCLALNKILYLRQVNTSWRSNKMPAILALRVMLGLIHLFQLYASPIDKTILANGIV